MIKVTYMRRVLQPIISKSELKLVQRHRLESIMVLRLAKAGLKAGSLCNAIQRNIYKINLSFSFKLVRVI